MVYDKIYIIAFFGFVDNGKTTLVEKISNKIIKKHSDELKKFITIKKGCTDLVLKKCKNCNRITDFKKNCSLESVTYYIIDNPGHKLYFNFSITSVSLIDFPVFVVASDEFKYLKKTSFQPQILPLIYKKFKSILVVQTKIDLISITEVKAQEIDLKKTFEGFGFENVFVVSYSVVSKKSLHNVLEVLSLINPIKKTCNNISIIKSYNINKPKTKIQNLKGGVIGIVKFEGSKVINKNDTIIIGPINNFYKSLKNTFIKRNIKEIYNKNFSVSKIKNRGFYSILLDMDFTFFKNDSFTGLYIMDKEPEVFNTFKIKVLYRNTKIILSVKDIVLCNIDIIKTVCKIMKMKKNIVYLESHIKIPFIDNALVVIFVKKNDSLELSIIGILQ